MTKITSATNSIFKIAKSSFKIIVGITFVIGSTLKFLKVKISSCLEKINFQLCYNESSNNSCYGDRHGKVS